MPFHIAPRGAVTREHSLLEQALEVGPAGRWQGCAGSFPQELQRGRCVRS